MGDGAAFHGAKLALLCDGSILTYLRDDKVGIPFPGFWDLPGGGREGTEGPIECVLRELDEEFALRLSPERLKWSRFYPSADPSEAGAFFFAGAIRADEIASIRFGDEGQCWGMMGLDEYLAHDLAVPVWFHV
ncbi:NUDIX hydrolase [Methylobacterium sp. J-067]|uniref:NUDIX hydrolase n=1 Tax=Methylobacterium sp. J-067 TaxID=2836648 RepID=UPI001FB9226E|nr:NUDIX hydrolase [Methylobacterium sp. J-067]MCJ2023436.1 NUDIX hydrolase [Methylobacterium sp. J-067]